jgi:hypothetical protein
MEGCLLIQFKCGGKSKRKMLECMPIVPFLVSGCQGVEAKIVVAQKCHVRSSTSCGVRLGRADSRLVEFTQREELEVDVSPL